MTTIRQLSIAARHAWQSAMHTREGMVRADVEKLIDLFFHGQDDSILQALGAD